VLLTLVAAARNFKLLDELEDAEKSSKSERGADISLGGRHMPRRRAPWQCERV
jgi:hypothetical protein